MRSVLICIQRLRALADPQHDGAAQTGGAEGAFIVIAQSGQQAGGQHRVAHQTIEAGAMAITIPRPVGSARPGIQQRLAIHQHRILAGRNEILGVTIAALEKIDQAQSTRPPAGSSA